MPPVVEQSKDNLGSWLSHRYIIEIRDLLLILSGNQKLEKSGAASGRRAFDSTPVGSDSVCSRSLTSFRDDRLFSVSFRAHREKSFFALQRDPFKLHHHPPVA
jgi:hypothetical protein